MELSGYLAVARRWWWTLLVAMWVAAFVGWLVASRITPTYEAQVQLLVGPINTDTVTLKASGLLAQTYAQLAISSPLLKSTALDSGDIDPIKLGQNVRATANDVTRILVIRVQDADPARAAKIANKMGDELIQLTTGATTRPEGQLEVIGSAVPPTAPIAPQVSLIVFLAMAAGLIGGLVLVIIVEYATDTVRDHNDLARLSATNVLATVGFDSRVPGRSRLAVAEATAPGSQSAVSFRLLASKVAFSESDTPTRTIMVGGVGDGDSAVVATGIAAAVAGSGHRAVVIDGSSDADITASLGMSGRTGLREVLTGGGDARSSLITGPAGLQVLPRGESGGAELIAVDRAREILDGLLRDVDLVVIDGGTMQRSAGALTWARAAQESILVVRRGSARREDLRLALESLRFVNATIGGTVLVQRSPGRGLGRRGRPPRPAGASATTGNATGATPAAPATATAFDPDRPFARPNAPSEPGLRPPMAVRAEVFDEPMDVAAPPELPAVPRATTPVIVRTTSSARTRSLGPGTEQAPSAAFETTSSPLADPEPSSIRPPSPKKSGPSTGRAQPVVDENRIVRRTPRPRQAD